MKDKQNLLIIAITQDNIDYLVVTHAHAHTSCIIVTGDVHNDRPPGAAGTTEGGAWIQTSVPWRHERQKTYDCPRLDEEPMSA